MVNRLVLRWKCSIAFWTSTLEASWLLGLFALGLSLAFTYESLTSLLRVVPGPWRSDMHVRLPAFLGLAFLLFPSVLTDLSEMARRQIGIPKR